MRQSRPNFFKSAFLLCLGIGVYQFLTMEDLRSAEESAPAHETTAPAAAKHVTEPSKKEASSVHTKGEPNTFMVNASAVQDLQKQRADLSVKQKELATKESELQQREKSIAEEMKKLDILRDTIEKTQALNKAQQDAKVNRLVETVLTMSPKAAAKLLSSVNETLAVSVMNLMDTARLGKILNVMDTGHSSRLSELMTGVLKSKKAVQTASNEKGGEKGANQERSPGGQSTDLAAAKPTDQVSKAGTAK